MHDELFTTDGWKIIHLRDDSDLDVRKYDLFVQFLKNKFETECQKSESELSGNFEDISLILDGGLEEEKKKLQGQRNGFHGCSHFLVLKDLEGIKSELILYERLRSEIIDVTGSVRLFGSDGKLKKRILNYEHSYVREDLGMHLDPFKPFVTAELSKLKDSIQKIYFLPLEAKLDLGYDFVKLAKTS